MYKGTFYKQPAAEMIPVSFRIYDDGLQFETIGDETPLQSYLWLFTAIHFEVTGDYFMRIMHQQHEGQKLEINDPAFVKVFLRKYKHSRHFFRRSGMQTAIVALSVFIGLVLLAFFLVLPWTADKVANNLPRTFDQQLGQTAMAGMNEVTDDSASALLTQFAAQIRWDTPDTLTFFVVPSAIENAYALPGGYVFLYTGLLKKVDKKEELAALLSHEVAHITYRHSVRKLCHDMSTNVVLSLLLANTGDMANMLFSNANGLYGMKYSRKFEKQADIAGMHTLRNNHIDQQGMLALMEVLKQLSDRSDAPEFISSHPLTTSRINYIREDISNNRATATEHTKMESLFRQLKAKYH